ncbi:D-Tyr tRNAtyr deacylase-like domain-containing protein [Lipomyces orientalis]|uniref:D-Tyr tRNAtyr deacylase-like domain-containing protein n=1 Tax=Lipomyces orientalis TaxID=1233043 RepID=A0ACC3TMC6_9ASCO
MHAVIQRVRSASVSVDGSVVSKINRGIVVLLGVEIGDTISDCDMLANKIANLRIFASPASGSVTPSESESAGSSGVSTPSADGGEMTRLDKQWDRSVVSIDGEILCISQFTLLASVKKNKPSFHHAERQAAVANELYERVMDKMRSAFGEGKDNKVKPGVFGAYMQVSLVNDGPVTIQLTSR